MKKNKVILIDASPIFYKAFFAVPYLNSKNGVPTNAAFGYTRTLISYLKEYQPEFISVCFDRKSEARTSIYSSYKKDRKPMSNSLSIQIPIVKKITESLGIKVIEKEGFEADDLIGMIAKIAEKEGHEVIIISPDKDLCQLVNEKTSVWDSNKKQLIDLNGVKSKFGVEAHQVVDLLGLSGDPVDGIPGIAGIGEKTAIKLIETYGNIENIIKNKDQLAKGVQKKIMEGEKIGIISKRLATIITDETLCPIKSVSEIRKNFADREFLTNYFDALNFLSLRSKINDLD